MPLTDMLFYFHMFENFQEYATLERTFLMYYIYDIMQKIGPKLGVELEAKWEYAPVPWYEEHERLEKCKRYNISETERMDRNELRFQQTKQHLIWRYRNAHRNDFFTYETWKEEYEKYSKCKEQLCWCNYNFNYSSRF